MTNPGWKIQASFFFFSALLSAVCSRAPFVVGSRERAQFIYKPHHFSVIIEHNLGSLTEHKSSWEKIGQTSCRLCLVMGCLSLFHRWFLAGADHQMWVTLYLHLCHGVGRKNMHLGWKETKAGGALCWQCIISYTLYSLKEMGLWHKRSQGGGPHLNMNSHT